MLYAIIAQDTDDSATGRKQAGADHLARLHQLREQGRMVLAGPFPAVDSQDPGEAGVTGSLIVAEFDDLDSARAWADADPYRSAGVYRSVDVRPFNQVLP